VSYDHLGAAQRWRAAVYLGLISSTFSTVVGQLSASRIGRDAAVDWMSVAAIPAGDWSLTAESVDRRCRDRYCLSSMADFSLGFGLLRSSWEMDRQSPSGLARRRCLAMGLLLPSALEWLVLVPLFPFRQPIFTLQQP
jgi:hypothetical protein